MNELITKVAESSGISPDQAKKSVETVTAYIKERLPESFHSQIDNLINGGKLSEGVKSKLNEVASDVRDKAEDVLKEVKEKADEVAGKIREIFSDKKEPNKDA
jgi:hypothetical protein